MSLGLPTRRKAPPHAVLCGQSNLFPSIRILIYLRLVVCPEVQFAVRSSPQMTATDTESVNGIQRWINPQW